MQTIHGDGFKVAIKKSNRRRTLAINIKNGEVAIFMPQQLPLTIAQDFVLKKTPWIKKKLQQQAQHVAKPKTFTQGDQILFLGQSYPLHFIEKNTAISIEKTSQSIHVYGRQYRFTKAAIRAALINWYKQQAQQFLLSRVEEHSHQTGLIPRSVITKTYKARWGSCHINGDIQLNWKLMMTPKQIIDYVIIHELCHLEQHNHSPAFWQLVERFIPNYKTDQQWLKTKGIPLLEF